MKHHCPELHGLSAFVHGCLASFHMLGAIYNLKRRNKIDAAVHVIGLVYSVRSSFYHVHRCKETDHAKDI